MSILTLLLLFVLGCLIGGLGGLFGIGGGLFAIPVLGLAFGMDQQLAQGTAIVMVAPNVLQGLWRNYRLGNLNPKKALILAASAVVFTYLAALVALSLDPTTLRIAFALFVVVIALRFLIRTLGKQSSTPGVAKLKQKWLALVGAVGGGISGLFGIGGAVFAPPLLTSLFGMRQAVAQAHALALVAPGTLVALTAYAAHDEVNWQYGIPLAIGGALTVSWGVRLANRMPEKLLRLLFCGLLLITAVGMLASLGSAN